jgi:succinoglycan biosynthesis transport protein ExoP
VDLKQLFNIFKRWFWLGILGLILGGAAGIFISRIQTPVYEASARLLVMRAPDQGTAALAYLSPAELAATFSQLITTQPVLDELSNQLGVKVDKSQIQIQEIPNSQIIKVTADSDDPQMSANIANGLIETATNQYVSLQTGLYKSSEKNVQTQLDDVQVKINSLQTQITQASEAILNDQINQVEAQMVPLQDEITQLQQDIAKLSPVTLATTADQKAQLAAKQARIDQIQPLLASYQQAYSDLVVLKKPIDTGSSEQENLLYLQKNLEQLQTSKGELTTNLTALQQSETQGVSNVIKIEDAYAPVTYIRPQPTVNVLLSAAIGLVLAVVLIFMIENMDISFRIPDFIRNWLFREKPQKIIKKAPGKQGTTG